MKRIDLVRHLESQGCQLMREGRQHSLYINRQTRKSAAVPRHREIPKGQFEYLPSSWYSVSVLKRLGAKLNRRIVQWLSTFKLKRRHLVKMHRCSARRQFAGSVGNSRPRVPGRRHPRDDCAALLYVGSPRRLRRPCLLFTPSQRGRGVPGPTRAEGRRSSTAN